MSVGYVAISWNHHKRMYDAAIAAFVVVFVAAFVGASKLAFNADHYLSDEVVVLRALGACAIVMLHVILCIGPAARLSTRFLPLLYNRRHLGVATFLVALAHGTLAIGYYHAFGDRNPFVSLFETSLSIESIRTLPFQLFGLGALAIMFVLAATSHDFWLSNLSARVWKGIHMSIYAAYLLLIAHVAFGMLQASHLALPGVLLIAGATLVTSLHLIAGLRERARDRDTVPEIDGWLDAGDPASIPDGRARVLCAGKGERIALFRSGDRLFATANVCAHQGGPLSEGKIVGGCVTCPWHGWQYRPEDGHSPPPFTEQISVHQVRIVDGRARVNPSPELRPRDPSNTAPAPGPTDA